MTRILYIDDVQQMLTLYGNYVKKQAAEQGMDIRLDTRLADDVKHDAAGYAEIASNYDMVVVDHNWGLGEKMNGLKYAQELRNAGFEKPIIIYSSALVKDLGAGAAAIMQSRKLLHCQKQDNAADLYAMIKGIIQPAVGTAAGENARAVR